MLGKLFHSKVTTKFAKLHYFLSQNVGGQKILCPPCPNVVRVMSLPPPLKLGPCSIHSRKKTSTIENIFILTTVHLLNMHWG